MKKLKKGIHEFLAFGFKEARACIFAGSFFALLFLSNYIPLFGLPRYDFLFLAAILLQIILVATKIESWAEVKTIFLFHVIGFVLEVFKTHPAIGSWSYPEAGFFKIADVPLYSGFMYAAVASYMMQSWRLFGLRLTNYPSYFLSLPLAAAIYLNFFTHHYLPDIRWYLALLVVVLFRNSWIEFTVIEKVRRMPVTLSFLLIGFFIWVAENIATAFGAWQYPGQADGWQLVGIDKISSWALLVIISFIIVADLKEIREKRNIDDQKNR